MRFKQTPILKLSITVTAWLALSACAPQQPSSEAEAEAEATPETRSVQPLRMVTATPQPRPTVNPSAAQSNLPTFDPQNPNWEIRYQELYTRYAEMFSPPSNGQSITIELANGSTKSGILNQLTATELSLDIGDGVITYASDALSEESASNFFQNAYARNRALTQGRIEYQRWESIQATARPTATPFPARTVREIAAAGGTPPNNPPIVEEAVPAYESSIPGIPKNEGPSGRVAQVDEYIRKNAALPHSLKIKAWGKVQPHKNGYQVRVQYSLESAEGFGVSHEDMMFFMNANGRVYQKAAVK